MTRSMNAREGYVLIKPFKVHGLGLCLRVSCLTPRGRHTGEIPIEWWRERVEYYERFGLNAVEVCFLVLEDWEVKEAARQIKEGIE